MRQNSSCSFLKKVNNNAGLAGHFIDQCPFRLQMQRSSRLGRTVEDLLAQPEHGLGDQDSVQQAINLKVTDRTIMLDNPATARPAKPIPANRQRGLLSRKACKKLGLYQMAKQTGLRSARFAAWNHVLLSQQ